jgi:electron transfer flavoprotein alpha subunit
LVKKVISVEAAHYENFLAENFAPVVTKLAG